MNSCNTPIIIIPFDIIREIIKLIVNCNDHYTALMLSQSCMTIRKLVQDTWFHRGLYGICPPSVCAIPMRIRMYLLNVRLHSFSVSRNWDLSDCLEFYQSYALIRKSDYDKLEKAISLLCPDKLCIRQHFGYDNRFLLGNLVLRAKRELIATKLWYQDSLYKIDTTIRYMFVQGKLALNICTGILLSRTYSETFGNIYKENRYLPPVLCEQSKDQQKHYQHDEDKTTNVTDPFVQVYGAFNALLFENAKLQLRHLMRFPKEEFSKVKMQTPNYVLYDFMEMYPEEFATMTYEWYRFPTIQSLLDFKRSIDEYCTKVASDVADSNFISLHFGVDTTGHVSVQIKHSMFPTITLPPSNLSDFDPSTDNNDKSHLNPNVYLVFKIRGSVLKKALTRACILDPKSVILHSVVSQTEKGGVSLWLTSSLSDFTRHTYIIAERSWDFFRD